MLHPVTSFPGKYAEDLSEVLSKPTPGITTVTYSNLVPGFCPGNHCNSIYSALQKAMTHKKSQSVNRTWVFKHGGGLLFISDHHVN